MTVKPLHHDSITVCSAVSWLIPIRVDNEMVRLDELKLSWKISFRSVTREKLSRDIIVIKTLHDDDY